MSLPILRPYQHDLVEQTVATFVDVRSVCMQLGTGGGKTATAAVILERARQKGYRSLFLAHLDELITDTHARLKSAGIRAGFVQAGRPSDPEAPVQVASLQTLHMRGERPPADLVILDECHRAMGTSVRGILDWYAKASLLGLTATPQRGDGQPLGDVFERLICGPNNAWLTEQGYLVPCDLRAPGNPRGNALSMCPADAYNEYTPGRRGIVFAANITHAKQLLAKFGPRAALFVGDTKRAEREALRAAVKRGAIDVLIGVGVFVEGFDLPELEAVILARPFSVTGSFLQAIGRGLRPAKGKKKCTVLDLRGAWQMHGLPDERRIWSLEGEAVKRAEKLAAMTRCPDCFAVFRPARACPRCGAAMGREARVPRVLKRAEKLELMSAMPQAERDLRYLTKLAELARRRQSNLTHQGVAAWALRAFRKQFHRDPEAVL